MNYCALRTSRGQTYSALLSRPISAADPKAGGVRVASSDDAAARTRFIGVGGDGWRARIEGCILLSEFVSEISLQLIRGLALTVQVFF